MEDAKGGSPPTIEDAKGGSPPSNQFHHFLVRLLSDAEMKMTRLMTFRMHVSNKVARETLKAQLDNNNRLLIVIGETRYLNVLDPKQVYTLDNVHTLRPPQMPFVDFKKAVWKKAAHLNLMSGGGLDDPPPHEKHYKDTRIPEELLQDVLALMFDTYMGKKTKAMVIKFHHRVVIGFVEALIEMYNLAFRPVDFNFVTQKKDKPKMMTYVLRAVPLPTKVAVSAASAASSASGSSSKSPASSAGSFI
jgi:hypothetical protein